MSKHLMIVESPAKAKTIEKYLGSDYTVKASFGHVRDLPKDDKAIDVENGFEPKYEVLPDKKQVISELRKIVKEVDTVYLATDEDREGEAISWHLANALGLDVASTQRIVFNEITKTAIQKALQNPRHIDQNLVNAQQARRVLDRIVGFRLSPVLWRKIRTGLSAGRVQSVAVRLIVEREREIIAFETTTFWRVTAEFDVDGATLKAKLNKRFSSKEEAKTFLETCLPAIYSISKLETKPSKKSPTAPFTTSTLQQEASRKLSFSVSRTMRVAQMLYEAGHITYMRTDSVNLSNDALQQAEQTIKQNYGNEYHKLRQYRNKNSSAQEAHEAIRPTNFGLESIQASRDEQRLYDLIWRRTLASQMADAQLERTNVDIAISTHDAIFKATGEVLIFDGFLKLYLESKDEDSEEDESKDVLPPLAVGQELDLKQIEALERYSRPPGRYTEASLVKKLEELGIGRPSTYAPTISTVQKRNYVEKGTHEGDKRDCGLLLLEDGKIAESKKTETAGSNKGRLVPTDLGMVVTDFLTKYFDTVLDYSFTAQIEDEFDEIASGKKAWNKMIAEFYNEFAPKVEYTKENADRAQNERQLGTDPKSGRDVIARLGKYGPMIQIGNRDEEEKPQFAKLRGNQRLETIELAEALELFKLPRELGEWDGEIIKANIGRYGPYVQHGKLFASLEEEDDPYEVTLERGIELIKLKRETEAKKLIKKIADDVQVLNGRWGPYLKYGKENVKIPKDVDPQELTMEDCDKLLEVHKNRPKRKRKSSGRKKK